MQGDPSDSPSLQRRMQAAGSNVMRYSSSENFTDINDQLNNSATLNSNSAYHSFKDIRNSFRKPGQ